MKKITHLIIALIILFGVASSFSANKETEKPYPTGCEPVGFSYEHGVLILKSKTETTPQSMFFIHNISQNDIEFYQIRDGSKPFIMHTHNELRMNLWAAYATGQKKTEFICTKATKEMYAGEILDCEKLLNICQYPKVKFALNNRGSYWVTTNKNQKSAVRTAIREGTLLKWW